jgi:hypothetical protein
MTHRFLGAALVAAVGMLLPGASRALAQVSAPEYKPTNVDSPHETPAGTTHSSDQYDLQQGEQGRWENEDRGAADERPQRERRADERREQTYAGKSRPDEREGRRSHDWRSEIRFGEPTNGGLAIVSVERGTPYFHSGLRQGDVIISYNGQAIRNEGDFGRWAIYRPGERVPVIVMRDGRRETVYITYDQERSLTDSADRDAQPAYESQAFLGVRFEPRMRGGAVISSVVPRSPAEQAGLQTGDEIVAINGREIRSAREATRAVASMKPGDRLDIEYSRRIHQKTQAVLDGKPDESQTAQNGRTEVQVFRGGPDYEQTAQPDNQQRLDQANNGYETSNRRGGGLLQRLRD